MGYDTLRFVDDIDDEFKCIICDSVLENAVQSPECEHTFCNECINEWLKLNKTCPIDRRPLKKTDLRPVPRSLRNLLGKLKIQCDFASYGCSEIVKLDLLSSHIKECDHNPKTPVICKKECGLSILRENISEHNCFKYLCQLVIKQQNDISELMQSNKRSIQQIWARIHDNVIRINGDIFEYLGDGMNDNDVGSIQARNCFNLRHSYFELEIVDPGKDCCIAIGLTRSNYRVNIQPGWRSESIGYHADDGKVFISSSKGDEFGPTCNRGDIMGCGILFPNDKIENVEVEVYFTKNGDKIGQRRIIVPKGGFYPTVGMHSTGEKVKINLFSLTNK